MKISTIILILSTSLLALSSKAQDSLLLTNGKIKNLKGVVVYYDNDEVLFQNEKQRNRMKKYVSRKEAKKLNASLKKTAAKEKKTTDAQIPRQLKQKENIKRLRESFEQEIEIKLNSLSPADFEKWKNKQLDKIKAAEKEQELDNMLKNQLVNIKQSRKEARERARFTNKVARDITFSILKADSTEIIVYNADTLGFFADGEADREYGVEEMRWFIKGQQAGRKHKVAFDVLLGVAVGAISSGAGAYWGPSIPAGTVICTSIFNNKIKNKAGVDPSLFDNEAFRDGYVRAAKRKKTWSFVKGSVVGLGFGILMWDGIVRGEGLPGPR